MKFFEVFKAGNYPQGVFSAQDVESLAKNYDPKFCEAPITLDHEQKGPAYGWVSELKAENGRLKASFRDVAAELKDYVQSGKYKKISVEIYKELEGKKPYLKAVSFLGAGIPQVKGMDPVEFKEGESEIYIFDIENNNSIEFAQEKADNKTIEELVKLQNQISEIESRIIILTDRPKKEYGELASDLQQKVQKMSAQIVKINEDVKKNQKAQFELSNLKKQIKEKEFEHFIDEQINSGHLTPAQRDTSLKILTALDSVEHFSETGCALEFMEYIKTFPKQFNCTEIATKEKVSSQEKEYHNFENASEESLVIYHEAKLLADKENISFRDALLKLNK